MKAKLLSLVIGLVITTITWAQNQNNFKYQAVLRDNLSNLITNQEVDIRISILQSSTDGSSIYTEEHTVTTNNQGLVSLYIGSGTIISGAFDTINWDTDSHFLQIELNHNNSDYVSMGIAPLLSVPYALHAQTVADKNDADADPANEIQTISISGDTIILSDGGSAKLPSSNVFSGDYEDLINIPEHIDTDSTNDFSGNFNDLTNKPGLAFSNPYLSIDGGNSIDLSPLQDADPSPTNEIQTISISGDTLQLSNDGGSVKLPAKVLGSDGDEVIFCVVNDNNDTVFAVYQDGVRVFVDDGTTKAARGGFAVATRSATKSTSKDILNVTTDSVRIYLEESTTKAARGGFAVATRSASKGTITGDILSVSDDSVRIYLEEGSGKAARGGFAVATRSATKSTADDILSVNSESTSVYIGDASQGFNVVNAGNSQNERLMKLTEDNYLIGHNSGTSITTGLYNLFLGYESGFSTTHANNNTFLGYMSGKANTSGANNVFIGNSTGMSATNSNQNVVIGYNCASDVNSTLSKSIIMGDNALTNMLTDIPIYSSLFMGDNAGTSLGTGSTKLSNCIFMGTNAGQGIRTTAVHGTSYSSIGISDNVAIGISSAKEADGYRNVYVGSSAGSAYVGNHNTMIGFSVGTQGGSGTYNVYIGDQVGLDSDGSSNTYIGRTAGCWVNGDYNVFLGYNAGRATNTSPRTESNRLRIGANNLIYGEFDTRLVQINNNLNVNGTLTYVKGVYEKSDDSKISKLKSFTNGLSLLDNINSYYFNHNNDVEKEQSSIGLNAAMLQEVLPELVREDKDGTLLINYSKISIVAVNAIKEQQGIIETQQEELNTVNMELSSVKKELEELKQMILDIKK